MQLVLIIPAIKLIATNYNYLSLIVYMIFRRTNYSIIQHPIQSYAKAI